MHHVFVALAHGAGAELGGVQAGVGLGDGEAGLLLAGDQRRQPAGALFVVAEHHDGIEAEDVHVHGRRAGEAGARGGDGLHHQGGLGHAQAGAAMFRRHGDAEPAVARQVGVQRLGETAFTVAFQPVFVGIARADAGHGVAQRQLIGGECKVLSLIHI